ncbi:MAG: hypothetical protein LBG90_06610 [Spirochaetaceae bacterium]|nr:hypothetical protein [Spirochaetaceae bacterium]
MGKKIFAVILFAAAAGNVFGQKNTISGGLGGIINIPLIVGVELYLDYERTIIPQFGVGFNVSGQFFPLGIFAIAGTNGKINNIFGYTLEGQARWYPFGGTFHLDAGLGFDHFLTSMPCFIITTEVGWNIKLGKSPFRLNIEALRLEFFVPLGDNPLKIQNLETDEWDTIKPFNIVTRIGFGFAF